MYIPLGGNRGSVGRTYLNLVLVFFLTGFWHGASWSFVAWGMLHGLFMVVERLGFEKVLEKIPKPIANFYTIVAVMLAWVLFRSETFAGATGYWAAMFRFDGSPVQMAMFWKEMGMELQIALVIGILGALGLFGYLGKWVNRLLDSKHVAAQGFSYCFHIGSAAFYVAILFFSTLYLVAGSYNPFIYYRF